MSQSLALLYGLFAGVGGMASYLTRGHVGSLVTAIGVGGSYWGSAYLIKRSEPVGYDIAFVTSLGCFGWSMYWFRKHGQYRQGAQTALFLLPACYYGYMTVLHHRGLIRTAPPPERKKYF